MKVTKKIAHDLFDLEDVEGFKLVEEGEWISDGKYEHCSHVYLHEPTQKYYSIFDSRTGSYYSDYTYTSEFDWENGCDLEEVVPIEKKVIHYVPVEKAKVTA